MSVQSSFPFQQKKNIFKSQKNVFTVQLPFLIEKIYLRKKETTVFFLVTAHFVLYMVTFEAYKRVQVNCSQSEVCRISNLGVFNCLTTYFILE